MKVTTWNMQGANHSTENKWNECVARLLGEADVICLQEAGTMPGSAQPWSPGFNVPEGVSMATWGGTERNRKYITYHRVGQRVNLAVVSKAAPTNVYLVRPAAGPANRQAVGATISGLTVFGIHAISPGGADAPGLLNAVQATMQTTNAPWVVAGDFNREPPINGYCCQPPNWYTYSVSEPRLKLDWCVTSWNADATGAVQAFNCSDHYPVLYDL